MKDRFFLRVAKFVRRVARGQTPLSFFCAAIAAVIVAAVTYFVIARFPGLSDYASIVAIVLPIFLTVTIYVSLVRFAKVVLSRQPGEVLVQLQHDAHVTGNVAVRRKPFEAPSAIKLARVSEKDVERFSTLNTRLFSKTRYAYNENRLRERNRSFYDKDPMTMMFVTVLKLYGRREVVGISHVLPLNASGASAYLVDGGLSDGQLSGVHISASDEAANHFVFFSLGMNQKTLTSFAGQPAIIGGLFVSHLRYLLKDRLARGALPPEITVWAQVTKPRRALGVALSRAGMVRTSLKTGDGSFFYSLRLTGLTNNHSIDLQAEAIQSALS